MPVISKFYGIVIRMYFRQSEHEPPHIHVKYGDFAAAIDIQNGQMLDGLLPCKTMNIVQEWVNEHRSELLQMWDTQIFHTVPPVG